MPEIKLFYPNCNCCSGSGSSGSGSCDCGFFQGVCGSSPVFTQCKKTFHVTVNVSFAGCGSTPFGSCGSGSSGSALQSGVVDGDAGSGSGSGSCLEQCPSCCDLVDAKYEMSLQCLQAGPNTWALISDSLFLDAGNPSLCSNWSLDGARDACKGKRDGCTFFSIQASGSNIYSAAFGTAIDGGMLWGFTDDVLFMPCSSFISVDSCEPLQVSGKLLAGAALSGISNSSSTFNYLNMPCFGPCLFPEGLDSATFDFVNERFCCINMTFTITEALP